MTIGEKIKKIRTEKGMTQKEVAKKCNMADSAIRKYESGRQTPKIETLHRIAAALGVPWYKIAPDELEADAVIAHVLDAGGLKLKGSHYEEEMLTAFRRLNLSGQIAAIQCVSDLTRNPSYQQKKTDEGE